MEKRKSMPRAGQSTGASADEFRKLVAAAGKLPAGKDYSDDDYVIVLFCVVLDFMLSVDQWWKARKYYTENHWDNIRGHSDLKRVLAEYGDSKEGNEKFAREIWNNNHWARAGLLRALVKFLDEREVKDFLSLKRWVENARFEKDVKGRIKYCYLTKQVNGKTRRFHLSMGQAIFHWLSIKVGIDTVKPDVHVHNFIADIIGRKLSNDEAITVIAQVAKEIGRKPSQLDSSIWEHGKSKQGSK